MKYDIYKIQEEVSKQVKRKRFIHSLGVMYTAQALAMKHDVSIEKAGLAGILHDMAKEMKDSNFIKYCRKNNLNISDDEMKMPFLLHGKVAAHMASVKFGINDEEILDAIIYHTTGKPAMTTLGKIIYVADFIEPGRKPLTALPEIRKEAFNNLDKACAMILANTIGYLEGKPDKLLDINSLNAYEYYKNNL